MGPALQNQQYNNVLRSNAVLDSTAPPHHQYLVHGQHIPVHASAASVQQAPIETAWYSQTTRLMSPGGQALPVSQQHQQIAVSMMSVPQPAHGYKAGALLQATSQLPHLSHDLAMHGLNSQSQAATSVHMSPHLGTQGGLHPWQQATTDTGVHSCATYCRLVDDCLHIVSTHLQISLSCETGSLL